MDKMNNPSHPGEFFKRQYMQALGMTVSETAQILGVSRKSLSEFVNCRRGTSIMMSKRISKAFGGDPDFWLKMQIQRDLWDARDADLSDVRTVITDNEKTMQ